MTLHKGRVGAFAIEAAHGTDKSFLNAATARLAQLGVRVIRSALRVLEEAYPVCNFEAQALFVYQRN